MGDPPGNVGGVHGDDGDAGLVGQAPGGEVVRYQRPRPTSRWMRRAIARLASTRSAHQRDTPGEAGPVVPTCGEGRWP